MVHVLQKVSLGPDANRRKAEPSAAACPSELVNKTTMVQALSSLVTLRVTTTLVGKDYLLRFRHCRSRAQTTARAPSPTLDAFCLPDRSRSRVGCAAGRQPHITQAARCPSAAAWPAPRTASAELERRGRGTDDAFWRSRATCMQLSRTHHRFTLRSLFRSLRTLPFAIRWLAIAVCAKKLTNF